MVAALGPLLFLIYNNDLNTAIKHINDSIKKLDKAVNSDL